MKVRFVPTSPKTRFGAGAGEQLHFLQSRGARRHATIGILRVSSFYEPFETILRAGRLR
jgi:hypothetical protein